MAGHLSSRRSQCITSYTNCRIPNFSLNTATFVSRVSKNKTSSNQQKLSCYRKDNHYIILMPEQGIIDYAGIETSSKEPKLAISLRELMLALCGVIKKFTGFSRMSVALNLLCFGALLRDNLQIGAFCLCIVNIINFLMRAHWRLANDLLCLCLTPETASLSSGFFLFIFLFCLQTSQLVAQSSVSNG